MNPIDIRPADLETVRRILREHVPDLEVHAFGSRVGWNARETSDLDLALMTDEPLSIDRTAGLRSAFTASDLPFRVDIVDWATASEKFRQRILADHVVLRPQTMEVDPPTEGWTAVPEARSPSEEWRATTLGDVVSLQRGFDLPTAERQQGPYPVVASTGPVGMHNRAMVRGPGVVVGRSGSLGGGQFIKPDYWPLNTTLWVKDFNNNDPRFCYFLLKSLDLKRFNAGSGVPTLNRNHIHPLPVRVPPVPEQRGIAHILGTLDDKIELNRRMNATLEAMARALFRSWFVDFDPVRAKMEGLDTGLPKDIADLLPDRLADSDVGEMPEGWCASTLAEVARPESGSRWSNHNAPDRILYVDLAKTKWGDIDDIQVYSRADAPSRGRRVLRRGDTIVGTVRPGNGSFALIDRDGLTGSTAFAVLRPTNPIEREFVWCAATSHDAIDRLAHLADGGAYPAVNSRAVRDTPVVLPGRRIRLAFSSLAAPLLNRLQENQRETRTLGALRDALLPKLVSGDLRIHVVDRVCEERTDG